MVAEHIITAGRNATDLHFERQEKSLARSNDVRCVEEVMKRGSQDGIIHNTAERDINSVGHIMEITIKGQKMINFGSCSYLGLENHPSLIEGAKRAVEKYGTQFTMSRAYLSIDLYDRLESLLGNIYSKPVLATASTTLAHMSALPVLVGDNDAVILDRQVHASVQTAAQLLKARGVPLNIVPHNDMDSLEKKLIDLKSKHEKIWYLADGVYSMYGDCAPFSALVDLLNRHKNFYLYVDDAHGVGWAGKHGSGVAHSHMAHHDRLIMTISLNKSFSSAGGAIVFATQAQKDLVRKCGGTMIFSGPIQPPMLGVACASAEFHLSNELEDRQSKLRFLVKNCNEGLQRYNLPQFHINDSPIFFIPVGKQEIAIAIIKRLMKDGYFVNVAGYPAVPLNMSGFRFTMNYHFSSDDVENFLSSIQRNYKAVLVENGLNELQVSKTFGIAPFQLFSGSKREKHDITTRAKEMSSRL